MSKKTADQAKKAVEDKLKQTETRLDEILKRMGIAGGQPA